MLFDFDLKLQICSIVISIISTFLFKVILKKNVKETLAFFLLCCYFIIVLKKTQFPIHINNMILEQEIGGIKFGRDINLIPLKDFAHWTSLVNIGMFVPIGFLLGYLVKEHWKKCLITGFVLSMIIESSQLLVNLLIGYNFRTFDVNDLIFNTLGTIIGYVFFNGCLKLYKKAEREEENERRGSKGQ